MFFRREQPRTLTFAERVRNLESAGFKVASQPDGTILIARNGIGTLLRESDSEVRLIRRAGVLMGDEIGALVDGGFQKFFRTPSGRRRPALASDLQAIHDFEEDLKESLGLVSLYNESLGTVSTLYLYDRVQDRDSGVPPRAWDKLDGQ